MENVYIEEHRGNQMRTFVGWLWVFVCFLMFALFSVFPMENSLCGSLVFACHTHKTVTDEMASPLIGKRTSPNAKASWGSCNLIAHRLSRRGSKESLRMS